MTDVATLLAATEIVLLIDWPSRDVPDTLARGGFTVVSKMKCLSPLGASLNKRTG